ncbi:uncharacterized protein ColSpa_10930 [Colletotrichum spaethianum]|uniref:Prolyl 4-hydroxylase alpha subunit Fe(2+) 2OG dioxygenase domain-containing protein n=1 Tax=Colletotrichum spaethianum TaxID=700344 RepID=A0AA37PEI9_9PEZI|nr:uncharacterized protein ColSpa_10930 [Colletotrichum spaethianum]GKT50749.1 hypothetical protein ColSpa_10930 [Colletotrichum spaethianum]
MDTSRETSAAAAPFEPSQIPQGAPAPAPATAIASEDIATEASASEAPPTGSTHDAGMAEHDKVADNAGIAKQPIGNQRAVNGGDDDDAASEASSALSTDAWASETFENDLLRALDAVQTPGTFASFHGLKHVDPELSVHDVGPIILPLQEPQIRKMIDKAVQAPFGKGSETIVDPTVRDTWELDPSHFELRSPRWEADLQKICAIVARDMGIKSPINAELYKLLVYEKGAMFKAHTDTEKCPGMFGTLVVCLPSVHKGGDVVVRHSGQTKTFKTSEAAQSFACWYSDVHHEVLPITDGYRVVLTYNLAIDPAAERPSAGLVRSENRALRHTLRRWLRKGADSGEVDHVYYGLDHEYTEASISVKALKGRDLAVVQTLQELASELDFDVLLALTEKKETGSAEPNGYDPRYNGHSRRDYGYYGGEDESDYDEESGPHELEEVLETELSVKVLVDLRGRPILRDMMLSQDNCLQADDFFDGVERKEEYEGYQGNWAVLIVRRDRIAQFLKGSLLGSNLYHNNESIKLLLTYLADSVLKGTPNKESAFATLKDVWNRCAHRVDGASLRLDSNAISTILRAIIEMKQWDFFESAAEHIRGALPFTYYEWLREQVDEGRVPFDKVRTGLASTVLGCNRFSECCEAIQAFAPADKPLSDEIREWVHETLVKGLKASAESASFVRQDGQWMVENAEKYADFDWLCSIIVPLVEDHFSIPAFALEFSSTLIFHARKKKFPGRKALELYKRLVKDFIAKLDFTKVHGPRTEEQIQKAARHTYGQTAPEPTTTAYNDLAVTPEALAELFGTLIKLSSPPREDLVIPLAIKLVSFAPKMQAADFDPLWIPFLQRLISFLGITETPLTTPRYQQIFCAILESYRDNYVGQKPANQAMNPHSGVNVRVQLHCTCANCLILLTFLRDPSRYVCRLPVGKRARHHLHKQIEQRGIPCSHVTDRSGPLETLVVTKLREKEDAEYEAKQKKAAEVFQSFDQTKLGLLLGEDYPAIAEGLWKRPVNLAPGRGGVTHTPTAGPPQPSTLPGVRPAAATPAVPPPRNVPVPGPFNTAREPALNRFPVPVTANSGGPLQPLPSLGPAALAATAPTPPQPSNVPPRAVKRKAEPEVIDLT